VFLFYFFSCLCILSGNISAQNPAVEAKLRDLDSNINPLLKQWNVQGLCIGIVIKNKLVFAKGYGYRDYDKRLPFTPSTLFKIASNTKLFTAIATGILVDKNKLAWDQPLKKYVPGIRFCNNELTKQITLRDILSHRTGISAHDEYWYKSDFNRKYFFDKLNTLEQVQPLRKKFIYNNWMYAVAGYVIELVSAKTWENFLAENIFNPLEMNNTIFDVKEMKKNPDHTEPYSENKKTKLLEHISIEEDPRGIWPAGGIISSINDISNWLIALMNNGMYKGKKVIPQAVISSTMEPATSTPNPFSEKGYKELLNLQYGMGRQTALYRGHVLALHGGDCKGFHSQISVMQDDSIGVIVFVAGDQGTALRNIITFNIYEKLLGMNETPWNKRLKKN